MYFFWFGFQLPITCKRIVKETLFKPFKDKELSAYFKSGVTLAYTL